LDEPAGIWWGIYIGKYLFSTIRRQQRGLGERFLQGERDRLACREAKKGDLCHKDDESSCDKVSGGFLPF